jgi:hypothetical protein
VHIRRLLSKIVGADPKLIEMNQRIIDSLPQIDTSAFDGVLKSIQWFSGNSSALSQVIENSMGAMQNPYVDRMGEISKVIAASTYQIADLGKMMPPIEYSQFEFMSKIQWTALDAISRSTSTQMLASVGKALEVNNLEKAISSIVSSLIVDEITDAANIAFLKNASGLTNYAISQLPRGTTTTLKNLTISTARKIAKTETLKYGFQDSTFFLQDIEDNDSHIDAHHANIIYSSLDFLAELTFDELYKFVNHCRTRSGLQLMHPVGRRILEIVQDWTPIVGFDKDRYFHARKLPFERQPYTIPQMEQLPIGMAGPGRYNNIDESHYYFADTAKGARVEITKHNRDVDYIQVAIIEPIREIRIADISVVDTQNQFLKYCRYAPDFAEAQQIPREYLLPSYFATCCKENNIDGIRYYGSNDYTNYVAWDDGYFNCIRQEFYDKGGNPVKP